MNGSNLISSLAAEFRRGIALTSRIDDATYTARHRGAGTIGEHFRHNLEFGANLVTGIESGRIDYCDRQRDPRLETERLYAIKKTESLIRSVEGLKETDPEKALQMRSEIDQDLWLPTSLARELEFLHSHTVHHYALIAAKLSSMNIDVPFEFGVAPSTLKYWANRAKNTAKA